MFQLILRDDDLSYFTDPILLEFWYGELWGRHPIHFATVPKIGLVEGAVPLEHLRNGDDSLFNIAENKALVEFIRRKIQEKKIILMQHGFTHKNYGADFELERNDLQLLTQELKEGKEILEQTFKIKIDTLVAPHDRFSKEAILAAESVGYKYISRGFAPLRREIQLANRQYLESYFTLVQFWMKHKTRLRYPKPLNFGKHTEIFNYRIENISQVNLPDIIKNAEEGGILSITLHYRTLNLQQKEIINFILKTLSR